MKIGTNCFCHYDMLEGLVIEQGCVEHDTHEFRDFLHRYLTADRLRINGIIEMVRLMYSDSTYTSEALDRVVKSLAV